MLATATVAPRALPPGNPSFCHRDPRRMGPREGAHPLVAQLDELMRERGNARYDVSEAAGLARKTVKEWMINGARPGVDSFEAALAAIGYRLHVRQVGRPDSELRHFQGAFRGRAITNPRSHWLVHFFRSQAEQHRLALSKVAEAANVPWYTMRAWWRPHPLNIPTLHGISAVLAVLGFQLEIRPVAEPR